MVLLPAIVIILLALLFWIEEKELSDYKKRTSDAFTKPKVEILEYLKWREEQ